MKIHPPALGPNLPVHPFTGLTALGLRRNGAPIWPVKGGSPDDDPPPEPEGDAGDDDPEAPPETGDAGKQAIDRMKTERNKARNELRDVKSQLEKLAPLQKLADVLAGQAGDDGDGKPDIDALAQRLAQHENDLKSERLARFRAEVAHEKGLTAAQARRLVGDTRDELAKDADDLLKDFKATNDGRGGRNGPRPDPSQGNRGGKPMSGREQALAEAQKRFGTKSTAT
jgi:hypothetical protein